MKKIIIILIVAAVAVFGIYVMSGDKISDSLVGPNLPAEVSNIKARGVVTEVNLEQAKVDGPYLLVVREENGDEAIIAVPSMMLELCAARPSIKHPTEIKVGMTVEASGALSSDGNIMPCESTNHYLKVVTK